MLRKRYGSVVRRSLVAVLLLGLVTFSVSGAAAAFKNIKVGDQALPVQLNDLDGQEHSLAQYKDAKAVLILFWATWSQRSINELEDLKKFEEKYGEQGLQILAVNVENQTMDDQDLRQIRTVIEKSAVGFPVLIDNGLKTYNEWGVIATPTTAIVDSEGTVSFDLSSYPTSAYEDMDEAIQKSLGLWVEEVVDEEAVPAYEPAREALLRLGLGKRHAQKGFMSKAMPEFQKAAVADSGWADPHIYIGFVHFRNGENDKAKESLEKAAGLDPDREETTLLTSYVLMSEEKVDEAIALLLHGELVEPISGEPAITDAEADPGPEPDPVSGEAVKEQEAAPATTETGAEPGTATVTGAETLAEGLAEVQALQAEGKSAEAASSLDELLSTRLAELGFTMKKKKKMDAMEKMKLMMQKKQGN
jgi:peroxiredoxin